MGPARAPSCPLARAAAALLIPLALHGAGLRTFHLTNLSGTDLLVTRRMGSPDLPPRLPDDLAPPLPPPGFPPLPGDPDGEFPPPLIPRPGIPRTPEWYGPALFRPLKPGAAATFRDPDAERTLEVDLVIRRIDGDQPIAFEGLLIRPWPGCPVPPWDGAPQEGRR
jgi:hypothetical protein